MSSGSSPSTTIQLPAGVTVGPGRETSQTSGQGAIVQGMVFPITLQDGTTTTVFIPYSQITNAATVQQLITARVQAIQSITGAGS